MAEKKIFYQGENITVKFNKENLGDNDFTISIYPHYYMDNSNKININRYDMTQDGNSFIFTIPFETTKSLPIGYYDFEMMIKGADGITRDIVKKNNIFYLEYSHLKNY